jgi:spore protease
MAVEFAPGCKSRRISAAVKRTDVELDGALAKRLNKPPGRYVTIETDSVKRGERGEFDGVKRELCKALREVVTGDNCLVAGLGNPNMTADALGKKVGEKLLITRHLETPRPAPRLSCVCPNVLGVTGIESFDIIKGVADRIRPSCVVAVDSLAGASTPRIASAFQISDAGITPGSGVGNHRTRFDSDSLGCPVISVGVPLVVYASTIIEDALGRPTELTDELAALVVTPKDIDLYTEDCAEIIAGALNLCFFGEELE